MEGPSGGYRPRTAGQQNGTNGNDGVRDWQRNTWYGPAPLNNNPFDEPEDAPELRESRSENVNDHTGDFWNAPGQAQGYRNPASASSTTATGNNEKADRKSNRVRLLRTGAAALLCVAALLLILRFAVYSVKEIRVTGNREVSAEDVIRASGIHRGDNILSLDENDVKERITNDYRLQFRYVTRELPSTVILSVREREPCCWLTYCGIIYEMDKYRMVLKESENPEDRPDNLVEIKGLDVRSNTMVGQYINLGSEMQQSIFTELFLEMKVLGCTDQIAEADISNTGSIILVTRDGYTAGLGDRENLHAKLRAMLLVRAELSRMGTLGGTINVTNPESPIYTP